jgi:hypothetical protein
MDSGPGHLALAGQIDNSHLLGLADMTGSCPVAMMVQARIFSGRRGNGRWPTRRVTARFRADARSPGSMADTSGGGALSSARLPPAKLAPASELGLRVVGQ